MILAGAAVIVGVSLISTPLVAVAVTGAFFITAVGLLLPGSLARGFFALLVVVLVGYAFLGRSFAYLGASPVFIGEALLGLGLLAALLYRHRFASFRSPVAWLLVAFCAWGAMRTLPYLSVYQMDALRDGVLWGYAVFALLVGSFLVHTPWRQRFFTTYSRVLPFYLWWVPCALILRRLFEDAAPRVPGSEISMLSLRAGDVCVHLGGVAAFLILGLHKSPENQSRSGIFRSEWLLWLAWMSGLLIAGSGNRGGLLAVITTLTLVFLFRPLRGARSFSRLGIAGLAFVLALVAYDISLDVGHRRQISPQQIFANVISISGGGQQDLQDLQGTRRFRLLWWTEIINYTVFGEYFWHGKGFGINLADDDGFQANKDGSLRTPHNVHLTVLARAGVPGFALWIVLQLAFAISLLLAYVRAQRSGQDYSARITIWILAYWLAFLVNASFDPYLEGPQGGIWFWSLFGLGIAVCLGRGEQGMNAGSPPRRGAIRNDEAESHPLQVHLGRA